MSTSQTTVHGWEDDPEPAVQTARPVPDLSKQPLAFSFPTPAPTPGIYDPGTAEFRYWAAAEALRRGADFWVRLIPVKSWEVGDTLPVLLDEGEDLNAFYDRRALNFFHGTGADGRTVFSGESPDVVCHEMGHAILDSFKPELFDAASQEAAAFHEGFADISAILSALQLKSLRVAILNDTSGQLSRSSRLSRLAEQLGTAIRAQAPDAVDPDCLRNAVNSFTYADPIELPPSGPAAQLSSEPHNFSRVMSGAVFEAMAGMLTASSANPTDDDLARIADETGKILIDAIVAAPVVPNFFAQVATQMVQASEAVNAEYPAVLRAIFVRRGIISLESAAAAHVMPAMAAAAVMAASAAPAQLALPGARYGLTQPLLVQAPAQPHHFAVTAGAPNGGAMQPPNAMEAARAFVDDLFRNGRVDDQKLTVTTARLTHGPRRLRTHELRADAGGLRLHRRLFDCGLCHGR